MSGSAIAASRQCYVPILLRTRASLVLVFAGIGTVIAVSSSERVSRLMARGFRLRQPGTGLPEVEASHGQFMVGMIAAALGYALFAAVAFWVARRLSSQLCAMLLVGIAVGCTVIFLYIYPKYGIPKSSVGFGDEDDALDILVDSVVEGFNPYDRLTYMGNPISPFMGAAVFSAPFRLIFGSAGYANVVLFPVLIYISVRNIGSRATLALTLCCCSSLGFFEYYLLGGDFFLSAALCCVLSYWYVNSLRSGTIPVFSAVLLAAACASRANMMLVLGACIVLGVSLYRRRAIGPGLIVSAVAAALIIPWWVESSVFFPMQTSSLLGPPIIQMIVLTLMVVAVLYVVFVARSITMIWTVGIALLPVVASAPDQMFRASVYFLWLTPHLKCLIDNEVRYVGSE